MRGTVEPGDAFVPAMAVPRQNVYVVLEMPTLERSTVIVWAMEDGEAYVMGISPRHADPSHWIAEGFVSLSDD